MSRLNKGNAKYILLLVLILLLFTITPYYTANAFAENGFHSFLTTDTIPLKGNPAISVSNSDSLQIKKNNAATNLSANDSLALPVNADTNIVTKTDTFSFRTSKDALEAPVVYHADDSMVMDIPSKKIILYGKQTKVTYIDNVLTSPRIEFDQEQV